jgi:hypothetical protein
MTGKLRQGLMALAGLLGLLVVIEAIMGEARLARIHAMAPPPGRTRQAAPPAADAVAVPGDLDGWLRMALARPLMSMTRRPAASADATDGGTDNGLPRLAGTIVSGDQAIAIFARPGPNKAVIVHKGGNVGGYTVTEILADRVVLEGPDGKQILRASFGPPFVSGYSNNVGGPGMPYIPPPGMTPGLVRPPVVPRLPGFARPGPNSAD